MVGAALVLAALVGAGGTLAVQTLRGDSEANPTTVKHFAGPSLSFDYPASWQLHVYREESRFSSAIVFISTAPMHEPCVTTKHADGTRIDCGWPIDRLDSNGVLIEWSANGFPGWTLGESSGIETTIDGRAAKIVQETQGDCQAVGADETLTAYVERDAPDNWYQMRACLKGPHLDEMQRQISLILATTDVLGG